MQQLPRCRYNTPLLLLLLAATVILLSSTTQCITTAGAAATSDNSAVESESSKLVRQTTQAYLDRYFERFDYKHLATVKSPTTELSTGSFSTAELRQRVVACMDLAQKHMQDHRDIYSDEAFKASKRLNVREDDSLRLFFVGDLLACLENLDRATAQTYTQLSRGGRRSLLGHSAIDQVFKRTASTPIEFTDNQAQVLSSVVDTYLTVGGESGDGPSMVDSFFSRLPISVLAGNMGFCYCAALLLGVLGGAVVIERTASTVLTAEASSAASSTVDSPQDSKTNGASSKGKKQKRR